MTNAEQVVKNVADYFSYESVFISVAWPEPPSVNQKKKVYVGTEMRTDGDG